MGHEHNGECCDQQEQHHHEIEQAHEHHLHVGSVCMAGQCEHPEHTMLREAFERELVAQLEAQNRHMTIAETPLSKRKEKSKKKKQQTTLWQFLAKTAQSATA